MIGQRQTGTAKLISPNQSESSPLLYFRHYFGAGIIIIIIYHKISAARRPFYLLISF